MSNHYYTDGAIHNDHHQEINIHGNLTTDALLTLAKGFLGNKEATDADCIEMPATGGSHPGADTPIELSEADQALLQRLLAYVDRGDWQAPATADRVKLYIRTLFGDDPVHLEADHREATRSFRAFFKGGRAGEHTDRVAVSMANVVGYLMQYQLIAGGQQAVSRALFGDDSQVNNLNKGRNGEGSRAFRQLIPLLEAYRKKLLADKA